MDFKKVGELVGSEITIRSFDSVEYVLFQQGEKPLKSATPQKGYKKVVKLVIYAGQEYMVGFSGGQVSQMMEAAMQGLKADLTDKTFAIKSNGKSGMDIRYFFNLIKEEEPFTAADLENMF